MCTALPCRQSANTTSCTYTFGIGAAEGTTCGSGQVSLFQKWFDKIIHKLKLNKSHKMCLSGVCTANSIAPVSSCPFGDDVLRNNQIANLPTTQMSCTDFFSYSLNTLNQFPVSYCSIQGFNSTCCSTCQRNFNNQNYF